MSQRDLSRIIIRVTACFGQLLCNLFQVANRTCHHVVGWSWRSGGDVSRQFSAVVSVFHSTRGYDVANHSRQRRTRLRSLSHATIRSPGRITRYTAWPCITEINCLLRIAVTLTSPPCISRCTVRLLSGLPVFVVDRWLLNCCKMCDPVCCLFCCIYVCICTLALKPDLLFKHYGARLRYRCSGSATFLQSSEHRV